MLSTHSFRSLLLVFAVLLGVHGIAQNFSGFSYQAVVRDNVGDPVPSQTVGVQVTIQVGPTDTYAETHSATTDAYGLIALTIGQGTPVGGSAIATFADVEWASGLPITYSVAVDLTGGTSYTFLSGGPFKAVPFAMHALTSDSSTTSLPQTLTLSNDTLYITGGNGVDLSGLAATPGWVLSGDTLHSDGKRVGIGTTAPSTELHVVGGIRYQDGNQAPAKLLTSDADGNASWQPLSAEGILGNGNMPPGDLSCLNNLASIATGDQPVCLALAGDHAYVVHEASDNMMVFDISDPAAPSLSATVATGDNPRSVAVAGNHAYVVNRSSNNMMVFNISNPAAPSLSATIATDSGPTSVAVAGNYAYVVNYDGFNMLVFDISNPAAPSLSATIAAAGGPTSVAVAGTYAYVANSLSDNMMVFDVSNPAAPSLSATIACGGSPRSVAVAGNYAYVVSSGSGMTVFNISNPAAPSLSATIATGSSPFSVAVAGNFAYVVNDGSGGMMVFDISNPAAPSLGASIFTGHQPRSVVVAGHYAYVVNRIGDNLAVFNLFCEQMITMDPLTGELTSQPPLWANLGDHIANANTGHVGIGTNTPDTSLHVVGGIKYQDGNQGAAKFLTSDAVGNASWQSLGAENIFGSWNVPPGDLSCVSLKATIATGDEPEVVAVAGNYAYVVNDQSDNMRVFDISNPAAPQVSATIAAGNGPHFVAVSGYYAYVVNRYSNNMMVFDIFDPAQPSLIATIATGNGPISVAVAGNYAYVANFGSDNMMVYNISNPSAPGLSATIATGDGPHSVAVVGNYAYVANFFGDNMMVFNISNPSAPGLSATIFTGDGSYCVTVAGNYAYVVNAGNNNMSVVNIDNPAAPFLVSTVTTGTFPVSVTVSGNYAYVVNGVSNNMVVFDISIPSAPNLRATIATGQNPSGVAVAGSYAYVANENSDNMMVFDLFCQNTISLDPVTGELSSVPDAWQFSGNAITNTNSGGVGIGTTTPGATLDVNGSVRLKDHHTFNSANGVINWGPSGHLFFRTLTVQGNIGGYVDRMMIANNGNVGIGTVAPSALLTVNGTANNPSGSWGVFSDARIKTVKRTFTDGLNVIERLRPVVFTYNEKAPLRSDKEQVGVIAQELELLAPYMVSQQENGELSDMRQVDNQAYVFLLINAVKELNAVVQEQQAVIDQLHASDAAKDEALNTLRAQLDANTTLMLQLQSVLEAQSRK